MAWYVLGGAVVTAPTGFIFDNAGAAGFNFYISPTGDDVSGTGSLANPWSITALNSKGNIYAGKRIGMLPGFYQYGTSGGVQTTLWALCNAVNGGVNNANLAALNVYGNVGGAPTVLACCDLNGNYSPRTAIISALNPINGAYPTTQSTLIGQGYLQVPLGNRGNVTLDGLVVTGGYQTGIGFLPQFIGTYPYTGVTLNTNVRIQNCEIYNIAGYPNQNMGGIDIQVLIGAYVGNNRIHDMVPTSGNTTNHNSAGIFAFKCRSTIHEFNTIYNCNAGIYEKDNNQGNSTTRYNFLEINGTYPNGALEDYSGGIAGDICDIYNNIFYVTNGGASPDGALNANNGAGNVPCAQVMRFHNNTCIFGQNTVGVGLFENSGNIAFFNNIVVCSIPNTVGLVCFPLPTSVLSNYNIYDDSAHTPYFATNNTAHLNGPDNNLSSLSAFQSAFSQDANSLRVTPTFAGTFGVLNAANYQQLSGASPQVGLGRVGGVSGGAAVNAGAWDGIVTQIGANFNNLIVTTPNGAPVPAAAVGERYELTLNAINTVNACTWSKVSGPAWLSVSSVSGNQGLVSGTPTSSGAVGAVIQATDSVTGFTGTIPL